MSNMKGIELDDSAPLRCLSPEEEMIYVGRDQLADTGR